MPGRLTVRRWLTFTAASVVLVSGLVLLSTSAADTGLAPDPEPTGGPATATAADNLVAGESPVVDQLATWAETKGKGKISPVKGGGKNR